MKRTMMAAAGVLLCGGAWGASSTPSDGIAREGQVLVGFSVGYIGSSTETDKIQAGSQTYSVDTTTKTVGGTTQMGKFVADGIAVFGSLGYMNLTTSFSVGGVPGGGTMTGGYSNLMVGEVGVQASFTSEALKAPPYAEVAVGYNVSTSPGNNDGAMLIRLGVGLRVPVGGPAAFRVGFNFTDQPNGKATQDQTSFSYSSTSFGLLVGMDFFL